MAIIKCTECGNELSDKAAACPGCGAPPPGKEVSSTSNLPKRKTSPVAWVALVGIVLGLGWYSQSREFKENSLPPLPVEVGYRSALLGPGLVLQVRNTASAPLFAMVTLSNPTTQARGTFRVDMAANGKAEIGHQEGWIVAPGDSFEITNNGFRTFRGQIP